MQTLAEIAWPLITNPLEFVFVALGFIVLIALIVQLIRTKSTAPYNGMPALVTVILMMMLLAGGSTIDLSQWPTVVATIVGFIVDLITSVFIWPYILMVLVATGIRVFNVATFDKIGHFKS
jgi:hypothetical protein